MMPFARSALFYIAIMLLTCAYAPCHALMLTQRHLRLSAMMPCAMRHMPYMRHARYAVIAAAP